MFSALNEKVEQLEKENEDLRVRLAAIEARLVEKTNQEDSKRVEEMLDERLGHHVCVGTSVEQNALFKNVNDFLTYDPNHVKYTTVSLLRGCNNFYIESLKFFPIFTETGFELSSCDWNIRFCLGGKHISTPFWISQQQTLVKGEGFGVFREACLKYNVHLLFNGEPVYEDKNPNFLQDITL